MSTPPPDTQKHMSFWEHLDELRVRLTRAMAAYVVGMCVAWYYRDAILRWLWKPFADAWTSHGLEGVPTLNFAAPSDAFMAYFKLSLVAGLLVASPFIFWQLWAFVAPGLFAKEKRIAIPFVLASSALFIVGGLFGWRVAFPVTFDYFLDLVREAHGAGMRITPVVMMGEYLDFVGQMLLAFGIVFELPLFILFLSIAGIVNYLQLLRFGRWFVLIAFIVGAILTPPDTTSQIVMSVPLCLLYFVSIGLAYLFGKKPSPEAIAEDRKRRAEAKQLRREVVDARRREKQAEKQKVARAEVATKKARADEAAAQKKARGAPPKDGPRA